jgi:hypothetical protein
MRHKALVRYVMIVSVLALIGCRNSATSPDPGVTSDGNTGNAAPTSGANSGPAQDSSAQKAPESTLAHVFAPKPIVVKAGKEIVITADQSVSSKTSNSGDQFDASLAEPVVVGDKVVIPKGAKATGTVTQAKSAGKFKGNAAIGAGAGAGAGTAGAAFTGDKDIVIAPETRLTFQLQEPLEVRKK